MEGWYRLPRSGVPYFGPIPEGAEEIDESAVAAAVVDPDVAVWDPATLLDGTVDEIVANADGYPIEVVRSLIVAEEAGRNRSSLVNQLERVAKAKEDIPPSG